MEIGRMLFFDTVTGDVIVNTGQWSRVKMKKTAAQQIVTYPELSERNRDTFDVIELEYGQYAQDFAESNGYRVNPETKTLEFSYPDPNEPEVPQPYIVPLSEQVSANTDYLLNVDFRLLMVEMGLM